jgi:lipid-binding SYLF domain-containing protein
MTMIERMRLAGAAASLALAAVLFLPGSAAAADAATIDREVAAALESLYEAAPGAKTLGSQAKGILVFPNIVKAGFLVGAQYGDGALLKRGKTAGYYNIAAGSYGFQAGVQSFGYAMFFMTDAALGYLDRSGGFEVGTGPSVVEVDEGMAKSMTTTTTRSDVYSFVFGQRGLMAGVGLQGSKITKIRR